MTDAQTLVATLLEDRLEEAGYSYLRVFGPEIPEAGYFYAGANPLMKFMNDRMPNVRISPTKLASYIDRFTGLGFKFMLKYEGRLIVYSQVNPRVGGEGLKAMEHTLGLRPATPVVWVNNNRQQSRAGAFFYGQPEESDSEVDYNKVEDQRLTQADVDPDAVEANPPEEDLPRKVDLDAGIPFKRQEELLKALDRRFSEVTVLKHVDRWDEFTAQQLAEWYTSNGVRVSPEEMEALAHFHGVKLATPK